MPCQAIRKVNQFHSITDTFYGFVKEKLINIFGEQVLNTDHNKILTLALALTEGVISNERLRYTLNLHKYDITKMLKELCNDGYLIAQGAGRGTTYHLNNESNLTSSEPNLTSSEPNLTSSGSTQPIKKKCSQNELFNIILESAGDWKSLEELAKEVHRNQQYLKSTIIPKMVKAGLIQRKYSILNHPAQKYRRIDQ